MAWIESHEDLKDHPKIYELCTTLNERKTTIIGVLHLLWHFTLKFAWRDGDISRYSRDAICKAIDWDGDPDVFFDALHKCGWMDDMVIHDWNHYAGKLVRDRIYNDERKRRKTSSNGVCRRKTAATVPYRTVPNRTIPNSKEERSIPPKIEDVIDHMKDEFEAKKFFVYYESNGWRVGKNPMKNWRAAATGWLARNQTTTKGEAYTPQQRETMRQLAEMREGMVANET